MADRWMSVAWRPGQPGGGRNRSPFAPGSPVRKGVGCYPWEIPGNLWGIRLNFSNLTRLQKVSIGAPDETGPAHALVLDSQS